MRIAACQMMSGLDPEQNVLRAVNLIQCSADSGAELVVLPEYFAHFSQSDASNLAIAETFDNGPIQDSIRMAAIKNRTWVIAGSIPIKGSDAKHFINASIAYNPHGDVVARYDKIHLFKYCSNNECYDEALVVEAGKKVVTFELQTWDAHTVRVGLSLCFDLRFPELFRMMSSPDLIVLPAAFTETTGRAHWATLLSARAIENQCYLLSAAQGGLHECGRRTWGHSCFIDPWGAPVSELASGEGVVIGELESSMIETVRTSLPSLNCRKLL